MEYNIDCKINCGFFDSDITFPGRVKTRERVVNHYELEICNDSSGKTFVDDVEYTYVENILVCAKPGQRRYSILPYKCIFIGITTENSTLVNHLNSLPNIMNFEENYRYKNLFRELALTSSAPYPGSDLYIYGRVMMIIAELIKDTRFSENTYMYKSSNDSIITKALDYIEKNFKEGITLDDVSRYVNLSPVYFHNKFLSAAGKTLHKCIIERRVNEAKKFLLTTGMTLTDIAFESGFTSQSYFNYVFKREVGSTPTAYKKLMMEKYME